MTEIFPTKAAKPFTPSLGKQTATLRNEDEPWEARGSSSQELLKSCGNNRGAWHVWNLYLDSTRVRSDWFSHLWGIFGDENEPFVDLTLKVGIDWVFRFRACCSQLYFLGVDVGRSSIDSVILSEWQIWAFRGLNYFFSHCSFSESKVRASSVLWSNCV